MLYVFLGLFVFVGLLYPLTLSKMERQCKDYFKECLDEGIYFPDANIINTNEMDPEIQKNAQRMIEIAKKYMKDPEFENEYIRRYNIGFEKYKTENMDELMAKLQQMHEEQMKDPAYAAWYAKQRKSDFSTRMAETIVSVRNAKPNKKLIKQVGDRFRKFADKVDKK